MIRRMAVIIACLVSTLNANFAAAILGKCPFSNKRGNSKGFGEHARQWSRVESRYDKITAEEFYDQYVRKSVPVVLRNSIRDWPAIKNWPNMTHLSSISGELALSADWTKVFEDHEYLRAHKVRRLLTMEDYIKRFNKENTYMDTPLFPALLKEMLWPEITNCDYFLDKMKAPSFFFNNGKSNTDIHIDDCETLFFQIAGKRIWVMVPPKDADCMYAGQDNFPFHSGISAVNQHKVNLTAFPKLSHSKVYAAVVNPGDLIYVPEGWFHNVMARGNPNIATTIFFNSGYCTKLFPETRTIAEYVDFCMKHRNAMLPRKIECKRKLSPTTTWNDVFDRYGIAKDGKESHQYEKIAFHHFSLTIAPGTRKKMWDNSSLPGMILQGEMQSIINTRFDKTQSVLQLRYTFFNPKLSDISPLAEHLQEFKVPRSRISLMLTIPHTISGLGASATTEWLTNALSRFKPYPVEKIDVVLMEFPPCIPSSPKLQDCDRNSQLTKERLASWSVLEDSLQAGMIRFIGVKDISRKELIEMSKHNKQRISIVSLRFDPLYRQPRLRVRIYKLGAKAMAHSVTGSGWIRDGLLDRNPIFDHPDVLLPIFEETQSVYSALYAWVLKKGLFVIPESTDKALVAEINYESVSYPLIDVLRKGLDNLVKLK